MFLHDVSEGITCPGLAPCRCGLAGLSGPGRVCRATFAGRAAPGRHGRGCQPLMARQL